MKLTRYGVMAAAALPLVFVAAYGVLPPWVDGHLNEVARPGPYPVSKRAARLHKSLLVADLHADALLWRRDLNRRSERGHVDVPRLIEGGVALQVFAAVTTAAKSWRSVLNARGAEGSHYGSNEAGSDGLRPLVMVAGWPVETWSSYAERALYQARKLHRTAEESEGRLTVITTRAGLRAYLDRRRADPNLTAGLLAIEGMQAIEGSLERFEELVDAGYRMMGPAHFFDTRVAGSAHGAAQGGLTAFGRTVIRRMEERGVAVDLAHISPAAFDDVLDVATRPVVVSHTGVQGTCPGPRNLTDEQVRRVAENGGVIGIGFFEKAVCGIEPADIVRAVRYTADLAGVDHVGLGSDFDGTVRTAFHAGGMALLTEALLADGFTPDEVRRIMGGNLLRVLMETLPEG